MLDKEMMDWNYVCPACMEEYKGEGDFPAICPFCGYKGFHTNGKDILLPRTILNGKYILGKILVQEEDEILYLAYDLNLDVKIHIRELYPKQYVKRGYDGRTIVPKKKNSLDKFKQLEEVYIELAKKLAQDSTVSGDMAYIREIFRENGTFYKVLIAKKTHEERSAFEYDRGTVSSIKKRKHFKSKI